MNDDVFKPQFLPGEPVHISAERFYFSPNITDLSDLAQVGSPPAVIQKTHAIVRHMTMTLPALSHRPLSSCLDIGCNGGALTSFLATRFPQTIGIDLSPYLIESASKRHPSISFRVSDARNLDFPPATFDVVVCSALIHYVPDWQAILSQSLKVLHPEGFLLIQFHRSLLPAELLLRGVMASFVGKRSWRRTVQQIQSYVKQKLTHHQVNANALPLTKVTNYLSSINATVKQLYRPRRLMVFSEDQIGMIVQHGKTKSPLHPATDKR